MQYVKFLNRTAKTAISLLVVKTITYCVFGFLAFAFSGFGQVIPRVSYAEFEKLYQQKNYDSIVQIDKAQFDDLPNPSLANLYSIYAKAFEKLNQEDKALDYYKTAKDIYFNENNLEQVAQINSSIYDLLSSQQGLEIDKSFYLNEIKQYAEETNSKKWLMRYYNHKGVDFYKKDESDSAKTYFFKGKALAVELDSIQSMYRFNINIGSLYNVDYKKNDSAIVYFKEALRLYDLDKTENKRENELFALYNNIGNAYRDLKKYDEALNFYRKAELMDLEDFNRKSKRILFSNMDANFYYKGDWENAYDYLYKYDSINQLINQKEQNSNIANIEEKYNNEKLRADNLEIEAKRIQNRNIAYGLGGSIFLGGIILVLGFSNFKRRQKLVKQQQEINTQKLVNQLKEQELKSIDALVEGQEKERLRIANDLHDDLGSLMATIKLHFGSLQNPKTSAELYQKTNSLLEEAYQKIRSIAHAKNAGVLAKQGLSIALKNMAAKASTNHQLQINVYDFDFNQRLENSVELTLFRILQELMTNAIKHGQASEIDIHLTSHENHINIMVEDNGVGFNPSQVTKNNPGMGLSSIDKRVALLDGKLVIESEKNKGTTIIINLPL
ncbi:tetratricopeptide repeat-containing sensor histidine kinase [Psychroflexus planctonicus]|uniref:tetratricopeptide repeat-containing sensor histidine kinase n=1 Tax=Psychroflexus planctonicus TaxID=1526575 RepID=UPI0016664814|nr:ATP-binding protein [Psychroflexus planctonicus]